MLTALSTSALGAAAAIAHPGFWHPVLFPFFFLIPVFWIVVVGLIVFFVARGRRRAWARAGFGPGYGPWAHGWGHGGWGAAARSAESTLAQRFANGDIDEQEYRARLEVLRANNGPTPPQA